MKTQFCPNRMKRSEAFHRACERNALRKEVKLPILPISDAVEVELRRDAIRVHYAAADHYRHAYEQIRRSVIGELEVERGRGAGESAGGRWIVTLRSNREFADFLASMGYERPMPAMTVYGSAKAKEAAVNGALDAVLD
jgi:hypothetical protein